MNQVPTGDAPALGGGASGVPGSLPPAMPKTSALAVMSLICGIASPCTLGLLAIPGLVLGIVGLARIRRSGGALAGRGMAIAGIITSAVGLLTLLIYAIIAIGLLRLGHVEESLSLTEDGTQGVASKPNQGKSFTITGCSEPIPRGDMSLVLVWYTASDGTNGSVRIPYSFSWESDAREAIAAQLVYLEKREQSLKSDKPYRVTAIDRMQTGQLRVRFEDEYPYPTDVVMPPIESMEWEDPNDLEHCWVVVDDKPGWEAEAHTRIMAKYARRAAQQQAAKEEAERKEKDRADLLERMEKYKPR